MLGGQDRQHLAVRTVERLDLERLEWEELASMHRERHSFGVAVVDGRILALGGCDWTNKCLEAVERFDPSQPAALSGPNEGLPGAWEKLPPLFRGRWGTVAINLVV